MAAPIHLLQLFLCVFHFGLPLRLRHFLLHLLALFLHPLLMLVVKKMEVKMKTTRFLRQMLQIQLQPMEKK